MDKGGPTHGLAATAEGAARRAARRAVRELNRAATRVQPKHPGAAKVLRKTARELPRAGRLLLRSTRPPAPQVAAAPQPAAPQPVVRAPVEVHPDVTAELRGARWIDEHRYELAGFAYPTSAQSDPYDEIRVELVALDGTAALRLPVEIRRSPEAANADKTGAKDRSHCGFRATFSAPALRVLAADGSNRFQVVVEVRAGETRLRSALRSRDGRSSAWVLLSEGLGTSLVRPTWGTGEGLVLTIVTPPLHAHRPALTGAGFRLELEVAPSFSPDRVVWLTEPPPPADVALHNVAGGRFALTVTPRLSSPAAPAAEGVWDLTLADRRDRRRRVHWLGPGRDRGTVWPADPRFALVPAPNGVLRLRYRTEVAATAVRSTPEGLVVTLRGAPDVVPVALELAGLRTALPGTVRTLPDSTVEGLVPLTVTAWSGRATLPPLGTYGVVAVLADGSRTAVVPDPLLSELMPARLEHPGTNLRANRDPSTGQLAVVVALPLADDEIGPFHLRRLAKLHSGTRARTEIGGVFLESWFGSSFSDNVAALLDELRAADLGPIKAVIADRSVEVPDGVEPVVRLTEEYWRSLGAARVAVFSSWFPTQVDKRPGQIWVQTWHGTPLKLLGSDREAPENREAKTRTLANTARHWDMLISQNPYSTEIFRRAYGFAGHVLESGYPRNDILRRPETPEARARVRAQLGLEPDAVAVLYAPTWRERTQTTLGPLEPGELAEALGDGFVVLARAHAMTIKRTSRVRGAGVVDVTSYPDMARLILASDCLVTDYSSVMFDYAVHARPMVFHTPDFEEYTEKGRGAYFDLRTQAPGPVVRTLPETVEAIRAQLGPGWSPGPEYKAWQEQYTPFDDGHAAERVVADIRRLLGS